MINALPLGTLLRVLQHRDGGPMSPVPAPPVSPAVAVKAVDGSPAQSRTPPDPRSSAPPTPAADLQFSRAGVLLSELLGAGTASATASGVTTSPRDAAPPLLAHAPAAASGDPVVPVHALAQALAEAIGESGAFYESHLAAWVAGRYPLARLAAEPQARRTATLATAAGALPAWAAPDDRSRAGIAPPPDEAMGAIVRQQIETLETNRIGWQGELWPGQRATVTITGDRPGAGAGADTPAARTAWQAHLALALPNLGDVAIDLALDGAALRVSVTAGSAGANLRLQAAARDLTSALAARSLTVAGLAFRHG